MMRGLQPLNFKWPDVVRYKENASVSAQKILTKARAEEMSLYLCVALAWRGLR